MTPSSSSSTSSSPAETPPLRSAWNQIQETLTGVLRTQGSLFQLGIQVCKECTYPPYYPHLIWEQVVFIGVRSLLLVAVTALATGSVMALQFGSGLEKFGGKLYVPKIVALCILREMGPVFTSLLVAGRIGSGIASEVGSMKVTQQVDAIRALGTSPIKRIVIPRVVASLIALPLLTLFADYIGLIGAMFVCVGDLGINTEFFISKTIDSLRISDLLSSMAKTAVFALFISLAACWKGLNTEGGTQGVGNSTTWVVVTSSIFIMISDFFLTKLFVIAVYAK